MQKERNKVHWVSMRALKSNIISLTEKDAAELAALEAGLFSRPWTKEQYQRLLRAGAEAAGKGQEAPFQVLALRGDNGALAAYVGFGLLLAAGEAEIYNIATAPPLRRRGLAKGLLRRVLAKAAALGLERAVLEVRESNQAALALYRSLGFGPCGRRKAYYDDNGEDALVLECPLYSPPAP